MVALVAAANLVLVVVAVNWARGDAGTGLRPPSVVAPPADTAWDGMDAQGRCDSAAELVRRPNPWPTICRWRAPEEGVRGLSFPPPVGEPPWDRPRIEVYVGATETRADVAHSIAHELGHMHHTRDFTREPEWLQARGLAPDLHWTVWTEDYAEVFAALYGPPTDRWRATTAPPSPADLADLERRFFAS